MNLIKPVSQSHASVAEVAPTLAKRFENLGSGESVPEAARKRERLFSLDFLRGLDMLFLAVVGTVVNAFHKGSPLPDDVMYQFRHPEWIGFSAYDMIMPLFIFMCGAALPLALPKYLDEDGRAGLGYWLHVLKRVALLWVLGMISQGELFSYDLQQISFFNNTLQTIAVGYLVTAAVARIPSKSVRIAIPFLLAAGYTAFIHLCGDLTPGGNAAVVYEVKLLSLFYPSIGWHPVKQIAEWHYTWWTTVPMFAVMGLAGYHATSILLAEKWKQATKASVQFAVGLALVAIGVALTAFGDPCVKHIYTASFTAIAMGVSFVLYSFCYALFDIRRWRMGTSLVVLFGRNSLFVYMLADTQFRRALSGIASVVVGSFSKRLPQETYLPLFAIAECATLVFAVWVWDWHKRGKRAAAKAAAVAAERK